MMAFRPNHPGARRAAVPLLIGVLCGCATSVGSFPPEPAAPQQAASPGQQGASFGMVIHGGAGTIERGQMTAEREREYLAALTEALQAGHRILAAGGSSLDAVVAAVNLLEDSPLFNAGRGAVFTSEGRNELDAAIMDGRTLNAGAIAGVTQVKNPINLARLVMEQSPHVMLIGPGAEAFGRQHGIELVPEDYFFTESRWEALQRAREAQGQPRLERPRPRGSAGAVEQVMDDRKWRCMAAPCSEELGTVGAVALDQAGDLAAATSTGGTTNKRWGRVGDVPIIGAGTYANNRSCAVSATGTGEYFIRATVAHDICALVEYRGMSLQAAAEEVVMRKLVELRGDGGVIAMDAAGNHAMPFNTSGMYRGRIGADGRATVAIYRD